MKQKLMAFGDDFSIKDEHGNEQFYFDGKVGAIGKKIEIQDHTKKVFAVLRQKLLSLRPSYKVKSTTGQELGHIYKKMFTFRPCFIISEKGSSDIQVKGKILEHEYTFYRNGKQIGTASKKYFRARDTYGIDIEHRSDTLLILSAAVVIDLICHPERDSSFK